MMREEKFPNDRLLYPPHDDREYEKAVRKHKRAMNKLDKAWRIYGEARERALEARNELDAQLKRLHEPLPGNREE